MDSLTIQAISQLSNNGLWAIFWWAFFRMLPELILVCAIVAGGRAIWKYNTKRDSA